MKSTVLTKRLNDIDVGLGEIISGIEAIYEHLGIRRSASGGISACGKYDVMLVPGSFPIVRQNSAPFQPSMEEKVGIQSRCGGFEIKLAAGRKPVVTPLLARASAREEQ